MSDDIKKRSLGIYRKSEGERGREKRPYTPRYDEGDEQTEFRRDKFRPDNRRRRESSGGFGKPRSYPERRDSRGREGGENKNYRGDGKNFRSKRKERDFGRGKRGFDAPFKNRIKTGENRDFSSSKNEIREDTVEGRNAVMEAIKAGRTIDKAWILKTPSGNMDPKLKVIFERLKKQNTVIIEAERAVLDRISVTEKHQGIICRCAVHEYYELDDLFKIAEERGESPAFLILDEIQDAYNLGAMLRIADAADFQGVIFQKHRTVGLDALTAKASAGAIEHVACCRVQNLAMTLDRLKEKGVWIIGTDADGEAYDSSELYREPAAIVIGSEGKGIRPVIREKCDQVLSIPMNGKVNSLNAACAAAVFAFELRRKRSEKE